MIMEMVSNRSFTLTSENSKRSRLRRLKNGVPKGSVLAPLLFNIYIWPSNHLSRKYAYADDLAIMIADGDWQAVKGVLSKDMATIGQYPQTWKLKLSTTKTVSVAFHLNNKEPKRELTVKYNNETLPFCSETKYPGVTLNRSLTYRWHLESLHKKLTSRVALLRRLAGSDWGAGATTLRITTLALVHSTAEYCVPVWCRSAHTHLIDPTINDALRIVTGCLCPISADNLSTLVGIESAELRRNGATLSLARRAMEPGHLLHSALTRPSSANARRLKSRHPFVPATQQLISLFDNNNIRVAQWADHQWNAVWTDSPTRLRIFIPDTGTHPPAPRSSAAKQWFEQLAQKKNFSQQGLSHQSLIGYSGYICRINVVVFSQLGEVVRHSGLCEFHSCVLCREVSHQGRNEGAQCPGRRITWGRPKAASLFCIAVHLLPKYLRFKHGGAKLVSCSWHNLTSVRPFVTWWTLRKIPIFDPCTWVNILSVITQDSWP